MDKKAVTIIFVPERLSKDVFSLGQMTEAIEDYFAEIFQTKMVYLIHEHDQVKTNGLWGKK